MNAGVIVRSLDLVAERCADPTPLVYKRLFAEHPEMEALFVRDKDGSVRGQMLSEVIEGVLDYVGRRAYSVGLIRNEIVNHENLGVPPEVFGTFFRTVMETFRDIAGVEWTPEMDAAWRGLVAELEGVAAAH
jgi:hemoglobin-like flavoprotein